MKQTALYLFIAASLAVSCNNETKTEPATKDTGSAVNTTPVAPPMDSAAMAKAWQDFATPGDMHKWMASHVGTWEAEVSQWMGGPEPTKSKAKDVVTMSMNGLYQMGYFSSTMMGMPMTGQSTLAYDNAKKQFIMTWIDNLGSGIVIMTGQYDATTKTMNLKGKQTDPTTGSDSDIRQENKYLDDDTYVMAMYGTGQDGKESKFMEGTFKRIKK